MTNGIEASTETLQTHAQFNTEANLWFQQLPRAERCLFLVVFLLTWWLFALHILIEYFIERMYKSYLKEKEKMEL